MHEFLLLIEKSYVHEVILCPRAIRLLTKYYNSRITYVVPGHSQFRESCSKTCTPLHYYTASQIMYWWHAPGIEKT